MTKKSWSRGREVEKQVGKQVPSRSTGGRMPRRSVCWEDSDREEFATWARTIDHADRHHRRSDLDKSQARRRFHDRRRDMPDY